MLLEKRGQFLVGQPFFEPGQQISIGKPPAKAKAGKLALIATPGGRSGNARAKVLRLLGSPEIARNVVEALMHDRGLRRRFPKSVLAAAAAAIPLDAAIFALLRCAGRSHFSWRYAELGGELRRREEAEHLLSLLTTPALADGASPSDALMSTPYSRPLPRWGRKACTVDQ